MNLSPVTRRRLMAFKSNRRGYISFCLFLGLLLLSSCLELIANDNPLLVKYQGRFFTPIFSFVADDQMGGDLPLACDFRDPETQARIAHAGWMLWPPIPYQGDTVDRFSPTPAPAPPSRQHWLGTDDQGRDVLARLLYGFRLSSFFGIILTAIATTLAICLGAIQGYLGGRVDLYLQRFTEIWSGLPVLYLIIMVSSFITPGFWGILFIMSLLSWTGLANLVRAEFLRTRQMDYVRSAILLGVSTPVILWRHILPNAMIAVLTFIPFVLNNGISLLTSLQFLGIGIPMGMASLGELLLQGKNNLHAPWLGITSFVAMTTLLSLLIFIGEGVRDAFDPRKVISGEEKVQ